MNFLKIITETEEEFEMIASMLFDNFAIQTYNALYRFAEIEFYWNSQTHVDNSTYQRKYVKPKTGDWFFHYSGVDIALNDESTGGYGGILIRSIFDVNSKKLFKGPLVCMMKLFSETNAFTGPINTKIINHVFEKATIQKSIRVGLGQNAMENGANKFNYRFLIDPMR